MTFHSILILIMSIVNQNKNEYYYNILLEKLSYKDKPIYIISLNEYL